MQESKLYDVCVIGAGLIGSAAAKHLAAKKRLVALVGPTEDQGALGACYDEGRIYRVSDPDPVWANLARLSIARYDNISDSSDRAFFDEVGFLAFGDPDSHYLSNSLRLMRDIFREGIDFKVYDGRLALETAFPYLCLPEVTHRWLGILSTRYAGHLSPRSMLGIQQQLAVDHGTNHIKGEATKVDGDAAQGFTIHTASGSVKARQVLLAAGAMTSLLPELLPAGHPPLDMNLRMSQALLMEVSSPLEGMPAMVYHGPVDPDQRWYILPPIRYPDGRLYLKMGYDGAALNRGLSSADEARRWLSAKQMVPRVQDMARDLGRALFPSLQFTGREGAVVCITDETVPTPDGWRRPYVDLVAPGLGIATGGNGWAGKSADHIGWLASEMLSTPSGWATDAETQKLFPQDAFQAHFRTCAAKL